MFPKYKFSQMVNPQLKQNFSSFRNLRSKQSRASCKWHFTQSVWVYINIWTLVIEEMLVCKPAQYSQFIWIIAVHKEYSLVWSSFCIAQGIHRLKYKHRCPTTQVTSVLATAVIDQNVLLPTVPLVSSKLSFKYSLQK